jgi:hypothetical protein
LVKILQRVERNRPGPVLRVELLYTTAAGQTAATPRVTSLQPPSFSAANELPLRSVTMSSPVTAHFLVPPTIAAGLGVR